MVKNLHQGQDGCQQNQNERCWWIKAQVVLENGLLVKGSAASPGGDQTSLTERLRVSIMSSVWRYPKSKDIFVNRVITHLLKIISYLWNSPGPCKRAERRGQVPKRRRIEAATNILHPSQPCGATKTVFRSFLLHRSCSFGSSKNTNKLRRQKLTHKAQKMRKPGKLWVEKVWSW